MCTPNSFRRAEGLNNLGSNELGRLDKGQSILCNTMYYYGSLLDILPARFMLPH